MFFCCGPKSTLGAVENNYRVDISNNMKLENNPTIPSQLDPDCYGSDNTSDDSCIDKQGDEGLDINLDDCIDFEYEDHQPDSQCKNENASQEIEVTDNGYKQNFGQYNGDNYENRCKEQRPNYRNQFGDSGSNHGYGCGEPCVVLSSSSERVALHRSSLKMSGLPRRASTGYRGEATRLLPTGKLKKKRSTISFVNDAKNQVKEKYEPCVVLSSSSERVVPRRSSLKMSPRRSSLKMSGLPRRASTGYRGEVTLLLPTGERKKKRTTISFVNDAKNQMKEIKPIYEMVEDTSRLWFQDDEYLDIKKEIYNIVKSTSDKSYKESKSRHCTRGLEHYTDIDSEETRDLAKKHVIQEYSLQKARGEYNEESIRQMYTFHTIESQVKANERAKNDAKEIKKYLKSARNINRRVSC